MSRNKLAGIIAVCIIVIIVVVVVVTHPREDVPPNSIPPDGTPSEGQQITGTVTLTPEVQGIIEVRNQQLVHGSNENPYSPEPEVQIEIKNISNESVQFEDSMNKKDRCRFRVISRDKEGQVLRDNYYIFMDLHYLAPKEVKSLMFHLFPSDETHYYEIIIEVGK